ncbi:MAG: hypothetical protein MUO76_10665 [Anaerolineaceae bacterium]|nr:hypothetical protein [Anaerolineaceae bacterium]
MKRLKNTKELKWNRLSSLGAVLQPIPFVSYDNVFDALMLLMVGPEVETVVHYLDDLVALLYQPETMEVVGIQVESFRKRFLQKYVEVNKAWRLSDVSTEDIDDFGDIYLVFEQKKPAVAREVIRVAEGLLSKHNNSSAPVFA